MASEGSLPITVLVVGASDRTRARVTEAIPAGEAEIVAVGDFTEAPSEPTRFFDLCIVEGASPDGTGVDVVRRARRRWPTLGIVCVDCDNPVAALTAGADDALPTSTPAEVVVAQIGAALRRARTASAQLRVAFGDVVYDREARRVWVAGREVALTPRELRLFDILFLRAGASVSIDTLQDYVWNGDGPPASNALTVYVSYLRRKLRESRLAAVETMRGVGYRLTRRDE